MNFKEWIKAEDLNDYKHKSALRLGWEGRQFELNSINEKLSKIHELSIKNFERYESTRREVVLLEQEIEKNSELVLHTKELRENNEKLESENHKLGHLLEKLARDVAIHSNELFNKDNLIKDFISKLESFDKEIEDTEAE